MPESLASESGSVASLIARFNNSNPNSTAGSEKLPNLTTRSRKIISDDCKFGNNNNSNANRAHDRASDFLTQKIDPGAAENELGLKNIIAAHNTTSQSSVKVTDSQEYLCNVGIPENSDYILSKSQSSNSHGTGDQYDTLRRHGSDDVTGMHSSKPSSSVDSNRKKSEAFITATPKRSKSLEHHLDWDLLPPPKAIIVDIGSFTIKTGCGGGGEYCPSSSVRTVVGRPKFTQSKVFSSNSNNKKCYGGLAIKSSDLGDVYLGKNAVEKSAVLGITTPFDVDGIQVKIISFDDVEMLLQNSLYDPDESFLNPKNNSNQYFPQHSLPFIVVESPLACSLERSRICQILFDNFAASAICFQNSAVLSLLAHSFWGRKSNFTGIVVDVGHSGTIITAIDCLDPMTGGTKRIPIGGSHITEFIYRHLPGPDGTVLSTVSEKEMCRRIKEQRCRIAQSNEQANEEIPTKNDKPFFTTDHNVVYPGNLIFRAGEILFHPEVSEFGGRAADSLQSSIAELVSTCAGNNLDLQKQLVANVILCGGGSALRGLSDRLASELKRKLPENLRSFVNVAEPTNMKTAAFRGAAQLASFVDLNTHFITSETYDRDGPACCNTDSRKTSVL